MSKKLSIAPKEERSKRSYTLPNQVKKRDRSICQCCGFVYDHVEAHHIYWIEQGGSDDLSNLISLCRQCHKNVPMDADKFLQYQRQGGIIWQRMLLNAIEVSGDPDQAAKLISGMRTDLFGVYAGVCDEDGEPPAWYDPIEAEIFALAAIAPHPSLPPHLRAGARASDRSLLLRAACLVLGRLF
jgi:hypothetical protein